MRGVMMTTTQVCAAEGCENEFVAKSANQIYCCRRCTSFHNQCGNCGTVIHKSAKLCVPCRSSVVVEKRMCARAGCENEFEITPRKARKRYCSRYCTVHEPCIDCGDLAKKVKGRPTRCKSCGCKQREYSEIRKCVVCDEQFVISTPNQTACPNCVKLGYRNKCADCEKPLTSNQASRCKPCADKYKIERYRRGEIRKRPKKYWDVIYTCDYCGTDFLIDGGKYRGMVNKGQDRFFCSSECGYADKRDIFGRSATQRHRIYHRSVQPIGMHRSTMLNSNDGKCWHCLREPSTDLHHVKPRSEGGSDHWTNLFPLCERCHYCAFEHKSEREHRARWGKGWDEYTVDYNMYTHEPLRHWFAQDNRLQQYNERYYERQDPEFLARFEKNQRQHEEWENYWRTLVDSMNEK